MERRKLKFYILLGIIITCYKFMTHSSTILNGRSAIATHYNPPLSSISSFSVYNPYGNNDSSVDKKVSNGILLLSATMISSVTKSTPEQTRFIITTTLASQLVMNGDFTLPHPFSYERVSIITNQQWYKDLQGMMRLHSSPLVYMVSSNSAYKEVLLNWLISAIIQANVPIQRILVIVYDDDTNTMLSNRDIPTIYVPFSAILGSDVAAKAPDFTKIMMTRLAIIRILNNWGIDVASFDTDSILLHDPEPIFHAYRDSQVVGMFGRFPPELIKEWGVVVCAGTFLIRSSSKSDELWTRIRGTNPRWFSDQKRLNYGLKSLGIHWSSGNKMDISQPVYGICENGLKVTLIPQSQACRTKACNHAKRSSYSIWHDGGAKDGGSKKSTAKRGGVWFLTNNWFKKCSNSNLTGYNWLNCMHV